MSKQQNERVLLLMIRLRKKALAAVVSAAALVSVLSGCGELTDAFSPTPTLAASSEEHEQEEQAANSSNNGGGNVFPFEFVAQDIYGNTVTEDSLGEKELFFIHYWGTWCPPCINEMPEMAEIVKEYGDRVGFIGLVDDYSSNASGARKIMDDSGVPQSFFNVDADNGDLAELLKMVQSGYVPTTVIIDRNGNQVGEVLVGAYGRAYGEEIDMRLS